MSGAAAALKRWNSMLSEGGYLVCSHLSWLTDSPPEEVAGFWSAEFPEMAAVSENRQTIAEAGYTPVADFQLPAQSWWANYYEPLEDRVETLREKYAGEPGALEMVETTQREIDLFRCYSDSYGYVFYVARKASMEPIEESELVASLRGVLSSSDEDVDEQNYYEYLRKKHQ